MALRIGIWMTDLRRLLSFGFSRNGESFSYAIIAIVESNVYIDILQPVKQAPTNQNIYHPT